MKWCVALLPALFANAALAAIPPKAEAAYVVGKFVDAAAIAEAEGSAEGLAFAARAHIADAITRTGPACLPCLNAAIALAERAIERDPNHAEGYVQFAIALGFGGRHLSASRAQSLQTPERGRAAIDKALKLEPNNTWANASLGAWHLEIVHRAGPVLAAVTYGAYRSDGLKHFRKALARDPSNLLLHFHFALSILALDSDEFHREALVALQVANKDPRTDTLTEFTRGRARFLEVLLTHGTTEQIEGFVRIYQGYP